MTYVTGLAVSYLKLSGADLGHRRGPLRIAVNTVLPYLISGDLLVFCGLEGRSFAVRILVLGGVRRKPGTAIASHGRPAKWPARRKPGQAPPVRAPRAPFQPAPA